MATPATDEAIEAAHRAIARTEKLLVERRKSITGPEDFLGAESVRVMERILARHRKALDELLHGNERREKADAERALLEVVRRAAPHRFK